MKGSLGEVLDRLVEPFDGEPGDWADVLQRTSGRRRMGLPRAALLAAAVLVLALVLAVPFGLAGRVIGLFKDEGKPVPVASLSQADRYALVLSMCSRVRLVTTPGRAPEKRCADGAPTITEIANNGTRLYWKAVFPNGLECLASGAVRGYRLTGGGRSHVGRMQCGSRANLFPTPKRPITVDAGMSFRPDDRRVRLLSASGLAGDGVASVGLVAKDGSVLTTSVKGRTYDFGKPPAREWDSIAAYDASGEELYRESLHLDLPVSVPHRQIRPAKQPPAKPLPALPRQRPLQHGEVPGAKIDVYRSGLVAVHLQKDSRAYRLLRPATSDPRVGVGCGDVAYGAGHWEMLGSGSYGVFGPEIRAAVSVVSRVQPRGETPRPPFDFCAMKGTYGLRWNDARGMHAAVEVPFTPIGKRYFAEQAVAMDLSHFMRTPQMRKVRKGMAAGRVPSGAQIAALFPARVVGLAARTDSAGAGNIGIWTNRNDVVVISRRADDGRRLFVTLRDGGRFGPNNLAGLKYLYY